MDVENSQTPLVSIIVITYNSSKYVLETLQSSLEQTYINIELIVSDDFSNDDTVAICKEWLLNRHSRFVRTLVIPSSKNTGIAANCNRGVKAANGKWLKLIAGDDALLPDCIELNINYVIKNKNIDVVQSYCDLYQDSFSKESFLTKARLNELPLFRDGITAIDQYHLLLRSFHIISPSIFLSNKVMENIGGYDETMRLVEDWPFFIKATKSGYKIHLLSMTTVKYRKSSSSVTKKGKPYRTEEHSRAIKNFAKKYIKGNTSKIYYYRNIWGLNTIIFLNRLQLNNNSLLSMVLFKLAERIRNR